MANEVKPSFKIKKAVVSSAWLRTFSRIQSVLFSLRSFGALAATKIFARIAAHVVTLFACTGCTISALRIGEDAQTVDHYTRAFKKNDSLYVSFQMREWKPGGYTPITTDRLDDGWAELGLDAKNLGIHAPRYRQISDGALPPEIEESGESVPIRSANLAVRQEKESLASTRFGGTSLAERVTSQAIQSESPPSRVALYSLPPPMEGFYLVNYDETDRPQAPILIYDPSPLPFRKYWWRYPAMAVAVPVIALSDLLMLTLHCLGLL